MSDTVFALLLATGSAAFGAWVALRFGRAAVAVVVRGRDD